MSARASTKLRAAAIAVMLLLLLAAFGAGCGGNGDSGTARGGGASDQPILSGKPAIKLTAPDTQGVGEVPGFEWEAAEGAATYRLVVLDGKGSMLWAWTGSETKVNLGGLPGERPEGVSGPVIDAGSTWSVVAFDASGNAVATSNISDVSP